MKKFLPVILLLVGVLIFTAAFVLVKSRKSAGQGDKEEEAVAELTLDKRPVISLTPTLDGHYLTLKIDNVKVKAESFDYELLYDTAQGVEQGVPGTEKLAGGAFSADLLLGSESSGKFRYDEGVERGSLTLKFRDASGKLIGKVTSNFRMFSGTPSLESPDGKFKVELTQSPKKAFFVVLEGIGLPEKPPEEVKEGPYAVFASTKEEYLGSAIVDGLKTYRHVAGTKWEIHENGSDLLNSDSGVFVGSSE